jgi:deazaflavin-dependent oxidoreductase (nitroreductase family)
MTPRRIPFIWRLLRRLNQRLATQVIGAGRGPAHLVLLLTTTGRKSGQPRVTPLQFEEVDGLYYVASARGPEADWFRNVVACPRVQVQLQDRRWDATAEPVTDPARIADFLALRLRRRPVMFRLMLLLEGVVWRADRRALERIARGKALVILHPEPPAGEK